MTTKLYNPQNNPKDIIYMDTNLIDIKCYSIPDKTFKTLVSVLLYAWSPKFIDRLAGLHITYRKGWYQLRAHASGNSICIQVNMECTEYRNTQKYYRRNKLPNQQGKLSDLPQNILPSIT